MTDRNPKKKVRGYAQAYLAGYREAIDSNYTSANQALHQIGADAAHLPLYGRVFGEDVSVAVLYTDHDFYLFFMDEPGVEFQALVGAGKAEGFTEERAYAVPSTLRVQHAKECLGITNSHILHEVDASGGSGFLGFDLDYIKANGRQHGTGHGNADGIKAVQQLPALLTAHARAEQLTHFRARYGRLYEPELSPQERGGVFEQLWRDVLQFYGWMPKKFRIPGEENDFTAIYQGLHILGEVRWFGAAMTGGKMREFLGKLDPRPQTIGLFISHSGLDDGAWSVLRRAVSSKTVVVCSADTK